MRTFDHRSYSSFKHKWGYHFYIKHLCVHIIWRCFSSIFRAKLPLDVRTPFKGSN